jgi:hypothetical protein
MPNVGKHAKRIVLVLGICAMAMSNSGCHLLVGLLDVVFDYCAFWECTPLIPVSPYWSQKIEDRYHWEERYAKVPVLDPVEGENAPLFCLDPPTPDEVMRSLPDDCSGGLYFFSETHRNNVRIVVEPIVDSIGECRFYPLVGPARLKKCHYKCTVYFDKTIRSDWPIPFQHNDQTQEVVYVDHDHLIRCAGPDANTTP